MCEKSIASFYNFYSYCNCVSLEDKIGGGNGNPLQCSCLENPRDGRAWWAAVYGVAQSQTRLKRLSSSRRQNKLKNLKTTLCSCKWLTTWHPHMTVLSKFLSDWKMLFMSWDKEYIDIQNVKLEAYPRYQDMINIRHQNEL